MSKLNIGVLGCANIAGRYVIPAIQNLQNEFNLVSVSSRSACKAEEFGSKFCVEPVVGYEELIKKADLNAVYIPLPNSLHYEWIKKALQNGLHVLSEKSLACSLRDVEELTEISFSNNLALVENFQFRFHRQFSQIQDIMGSGKLGEVRCIRSSFGFPPFPDNDNIRYQKSLGGGALLDAGAYPLKLSSLLLGSDISVDASSLCYDQDRHVDLWGGAFIRQKYGDMFSEVAFGFDNYYQCSLEIWGSKAKLTTDRIFTAPPGFRPTIEVHKPAEIETITVEEDNHFVNMLRYFNAVADSHDLIRKEGQMNLEQAKLIDELRKRSDER
jgi:dTDP-3,4-didehydro-2,6-dideoxy-alpha-D-glucose 3-reductase